MPFAAAVVAVTMGILYTWHTVDLRPLPAASPTARNTPAQASTEGNPTKSTSHPTPTTRDYQVIADNSAGRSLSGIDQSVVGRPFQISASVKQGCMGETVECPLVLASVARMVNQPRDIDWAKKMEEKIQGVVDRQKPGAYLIRNLECRTSTCILEVECRDGPFVARYDQAITSSLRPNALTIGVPEYDSSGASFSLELMDFVRQ